MSAGLAFMGNGGQGVLAGLGDLHGRPDEDYTEGPHKAAAALKVAVGSEGSSASLREPSTLAKFLRMSGAEIKFFGPEAKV